MSATSKKSTHIGHLGSPRPPKWQKKIYISADNIVVSLLKEIFYICYSIFNQRNLLKQKYMV
jgi:hypothetical protein